ncbi:MAG: response regulator transcription factor [Gemmatimonadetes bacterium]|nr:response regulator transcription factor [Gemmatimonadota bacterium]
MSARVLVVEDQKELAELLAHNLRIEGLEVRVVLDGRDAVALVTTWMPDLVLLDLMLPGLDGFEVLRAIRGRTRRLPVLILSARGEEQDKVRGFRLDADQYVTKPFSLSELIERVHALLRRSAALAPADAGSATIAFGDVRVDPAARTITRDDAPVPVSPKAFDLLLALVRRQGRVASRTELLHEVWGYGPLVLSRTVDSHVAELRRKLEADPAEPRHILTVYKSGYRFEAHGGPITTR